jgi:hypothetical protein
MKRDTVTLFSEHPVYLAFMVTEPDEREPGMGVLATFVNGHRIARRTLQADEDITDLAQEPRSLMYVCWEGDPGIQAQLFALTPDESEAWKGASGMEGHYLGTVVRAQEFRVHPNSLYDEGVDHFAAILGGKNY